MVFVVACTATEIEVAVGFALLGALPAHPRKQLGSLVVVASRRHSKEGARDGALSSASGDGRE